MLQTNWPADKVERWPIGKLTPYARNSRTHTKEQISAIARSITKWGWTVPAIVDETGMLICGHARVLAAKKLGLREIPVMVATGWSEDDKRAYAIADNRLGESRFENDMLVMELGDLASAGFDLNLTGFDADSLAHLLTPSVFEDDDEETEKPTRAPAITVTVANPMNIPSVAAILRKAISGSGLKGIRVKEPR